MNTNIKRNRSTWLMLCVMGVFTLALPAQAASFDCAKAKLKVEKLICADAELSKLDEELNAAYQAALLKAKQTKSIRQAQKRWLKERDGCADAACVARAYEERLRAMSLPASVSASVGSAQKGAPPHAEKGCYKLVVGKRFAMCREFGNNLNRFCDEPPMSRVTINSEFGKNFSTPKWEELDPAKNLDLVADIVRSHFRAPGVAIHPEDSKCSEKCAEGEWQKQKSDYMDGISAGRVLLSRARFDLNHDGTQELVYRLSGSQNLLDDSIRLSKVKSNFTLMVMDEKTGKEDPDFATDDNAGVDVLLHQGRAHLVRWNYRRVLDGNATPGTSRGLPDGMTGGNFSIYDIVTGGPNVGRYYIQMRPLCGYNRLDKKEN